MKTRTVRCPYCQSLLDTPVSLEGKDAQCPFCKKNFTVKRQETSAFFRNRSWVILGIVSIFIIICVIIFICCANDRNATPPINVIDTQDVTQANPAAIPLPDIPANPTTTPLPDVAAETTHEPEQEVHDLQIRLQEMKTQIDLAHYDRGQTFGEHLDRLSQYYNNAEDTMRASENKERIFRAHEWYTKALQEADWLIENALLRESSQKIISEVDTALQKAMQFDAESFAPEEYEEGQQLLTAAKTDYEAGNFAQASEKLNESLKKIEKAFSIARVATIQKLLSSGQRAFQRKRWQEAKNAAEAVLTIDPENTEAQNLKIDAEEKLSPHLTVIATVNGESVFADIKIIPDFVSRRKNDIELEKGKCYQLHIAYKNGPDTWEASQEIIADWSGVSEITIALKKSSFSGIVYLPGKVTLELVKIEHGIFTMGSPANERERGTDEQQHQVTLTQDYWIGKFEVTQAQYTAVTGQNPSAHRGRNYPVENVSWHDAMQFCAKLNHLTDGERPAGYIYSLPTEAQWEFAARGGICCRSYNIYSGSNNASSVAWYKKNRDEVTHEVGKKRANELGIYDMSGNVWEWCRDNYQSYSAEPQIDPIGKGNQYVSRGGGCLWYESGCRNARRNTDQKAYVDRGFRIALVKESQPAQPPISTKTINRQSQQLPMPEKGLVFFAPLQSQSFSIVKGKTSNIVGNIQFTVDSGIPCAYFDGGSYLAFPSKSIPHAGKPCTVSLWMKCIRLARKETNIFSFPSKNIFLNRYNGNLVVQDGSDNSKDCATNFRYDLWNHIVLRCSRSNVSVFINGEQKANFPASQRQNGDTGYIGTAYRFVPHNIFCGYLCGIRVYNRELSDTEIATLLFWT